MTETILGRIVALQVQRQPLKSRGEGYDPAPILAGEEAAVGPGGMILRHDGGWVLDVHHAAHPRSRGGGNRALSIGFTGHYDQMTSRFGSATPGCAGENIIVGFGGTLSESDLAGLVVIRADEGEIELANARIAAPCAEFTSFLLGLDEVMPKRELGEAIEFLDGGMRGFILDVSHLEHPVTVRAGDEVVLRPAAS